jgi:hypothetical protein
MPSRFKCLPIEPFGTALSTLSGQRPNVCRGSKRAPAGFPPGGQTQTSADECCRNPVVTIAREFDTRRGYLTVPCRQSDFCRRAPTSSKRRLRSGSRQCQRKIATRAIPGGQQVLPRRHDPGNGANETIDGLDATTEEIRHAAEDTPSEAGLKRSTKLQCSTGLI